MIEAQAAESDEDYAKFAAVADVDVDDEKDSVAAAVKKAQEVFPGATLDEDSVPF